MAKVCFFFTFLTFTISVHTFYHDLAHGMHNRLSNNHLTRNFGKFKPRVVHGKIPDHHRFPFLADVKFSIPTGEYTICTGTIIASRYVLTAYRCFLYAEHLSVTDINTAGSNMRIVVGSQFRDEGLRYNVSKVHLIAFDTATIRHVDGIGGIVVLQLNEHIKFSRDEAPILLGEYEPRKNDRFEIAGFGSHFLPNGSSVYEDSYVIGNATVYNNTGPDANYFTTFDYENGPTAGDVGGPAIKFVNSMNYQVGVILGTIQRFDPIVDKTEVTATFAKIGPYCSDIQRVTEGQAKCYRLERPIG